MSEAGEFRGSGFFRIDREKALQKLSAFQLERAEQFLLPLARCAAAAESSRLEVTGRTSLKARFTGTPFTRAELEDPYGALFIEGSEPRRRHFAAFLLGALRTGPREVVVESGSGADRFRLRTSGLDKETVEHAGLRDVGTAVEVRWGALGCLRNLGPAMDAARAAWEMTPAGFTVDGFIPGDKSVARLVKREDRGEVRLRVQPAENPGETRITFCCCGVCVETITTLLPDVQVRAWVNDDGFALTASQSAVVEDARRQKALDAVATAAAGFLPETAERFKAALAEGRPASGAPEWIDEARGWFSETFRRRAAESRAAPDILWETPFLTDASGRALSPATLKRGLASGGQAAYSTARTSAARLPRPVAYCPAKEDRALLESLFPGALLDATQLIESLAKLT